MFSNMEIVHFAILHSLLSYSNVWNRNYYFENTEQASHRYIFPFTKPNLYRKRKWKGDPDNKKLEVGWKSAPVNSLIWSWMKETEYQLNSECHPESNETLFPDCQLATCITHLENCLSLDSMLRCRIHILVKAEPISLVAPEKVKKTTALLIRTCITRSFWQRK